VLIDRGVPAGAVKAWAGAPKSFPVTRAMRRPTTVLVRALLAALAMTVSGGVGAQAQDPSPAFREKLETCFACHGPGGVSETPEVPSLAGQPDLFIQWQLVYMRDETRRVEPMMEIVKDMTDAEIRGFGALFAKLAPPRAAEGPDPDPALSDAGAKLVPPRRCTSCHLDNMEGRGEMPRLAGQREDYLVKAFHDYRSNVRRGRGNAAMVSIAYTLQDEDIRALAHYLARLR
jgi:cytochrome c553